MSDAARPTLTVDWMFPDLLWLNGDRGNLMALDRLGEQLGFDVVLNRIEDVSQPVPADLAVFGSGDLDVLTALAADGEKLRAFLASTRRIVVFGTSITLFTRSTTRVDHPGFAGLGMLPATAAERPTDGHVYGDDYLIEHAPGTAHPVAAGIYVKTVTVEVDPGVAPFAKVLFGLDNTGRLTNSGFDGARHDKLVWTNLLGPAFVRNPWLARSLVEELIGPQGGELDDEWDLERSSLEATKAFIAAKRG
jgi:CobQ-like glutamine amidotransferase family enzyme